MNVLNLSALIPMEVEYPLDSNVNITNNITNYFYGFLSRIICQNDGQYFKSPFLCTLVKSGLAPILNLDIKKEGFISPLFISSENLWMEREPNQSLSHRFSDTRIRYLLPFGSLSSIHQMCLLDTLT